MTTCSKRCNTERKKANRIARGAANAEGDDAMMSDSSSDEPSGGGDVDDAKAARKASKKAAKAARRAKREGTAGSDVGQKACDLCERKVDLLVRCQLSTSRDWSFVCGRCWKTPAVAGGVVDGDGANPNYRYGGLWKNLHRAVPA